MPRSMLTEDQTNLLHSKLIKGQRSLPRGKWDRHRPFTVTLEASLFEPSAFDGVPSQEQARAFEGADVQQA